MRSYLIEQLYSKDKTPLEFKWDSLQVPPLCNYLSYQDMYQLYNIATSLRYSSKIKMKRQAIDNILVPRGFKFFHSGTNRIVYQYLEDTRFLIKIALDEVGMKDNPAEYKAQYLLKPFVTKVFDVTPDGCIGSFERISPILNREEFKLVAEDVYNLLTKCILGKYIMNDIGTNSWMNYGIRPGFGVCLLDFPYCYELDGSKLYCIKPRYPNTKFPLCGGEIDYDFGFNNLICTKCGAKYNPKDLEVKIKKKELFMLKGGKHIMTTDFYVYKGNKLVKTIKNEPNDATKIIENYDNVNNKSQYVAEPYIMDFVREYHNEIEAIINSRIPMEEIMKVVNKYYDDHEGKDEVTVNHEDDYENNPRPNEEMYYAAEKQDMQYKSKKQQRRFNSKKNFDKF